MKQVVLVLLLLLGMILMPVGVSCFDLQIGAKYRNVLNPRPKTFGEIETDLP